MSHDFFAALILPIYPVAGRMQMTPPCHRHFTAIDGTHTRTHLILLPPAFSIARAKSPKMDSPATPDLAGKLQPSNGILWTYGYGHKRNRMTKRV